MKAVIVEIRGTQAAALMEDGQFVRIPDNDYSIGQEITLLRRPVEKKKKQSTFRRKIAAIAASAVLIATVGGGGIVYATPYGTVSIDVNPSIEYTINRFDRVLQVTGVNEEGQAVINAIGRNKLLNRTINTALSTTINQMEADGYLTEEDDPVVLSSETGSEQHSAELASSLEMHFSPQMEVYSLTVTQAEVASAHEKGITAGKMHFIREIEREEPETFREEDWIGRPVKDLVNFGRRAESKPESAQPGREACASANNIPEAPEQQKPDHYSGDTPGEGMGSGEYPDPRLQAGPSQEQMPDPREKAENPSVQTEGIEAPSMHGEPGQRSDPHPSDRQGDDPDVNHGQKGPQLTGPAEPAK